MDLLEKVVRTVPILAARITPRYVYITETRSSFERDAYRQIFAEKILIPLREHNPGIYQTQELRLEVSLGELYANAIIHGNQAGTKEDYEKRGLPLPEKVETNRQKKVVLEAIIGTGYCIFSVQDEGDWTDLAGAIERSKQTGQQELSGRGLGIIAG